MVKRTHERCRALYDSVMFEVKARVPKRIINRAIACICSGTQKHKEFILRSDELLPDGFYYNATSCCMLSVKAEAWKVFLSQHPDITKK